MNRLKFDRQGENPERWLGARVVSIISGKGGVGKSVLAYNLAERMVASGILVLLVDADFCCGNLHILANQACEHGISEFIEDQLPLDRARTVVADNLHLLASPQVGMNKHLADPETASHLLTRLQREGSAYDVILIDHSSGISEAAVAMVQGSNLNLITVVPELTSISDGYGLYKHLLETGGADQSRLLVNRVIATEEADNVRNKFGALTGRFLGHPLECLGSIPEDVSVRNAIASQVAVAQHNPDCKATKALSTLARTVVRELFKDRIPTGSAQTEKINIEAAMADIKG
ncbi:MAG: P-loop NTPase [candidate division Zixibacteria bacterium]|nr:P-loop NTPase [candidate division Zixibacteria bacterium]